MYGWFKKHIFAIRFNVKCLSLRIVYKKTLVNFLTESLVQNINCSSLKFSNYSQNTCELKTHGGNIFFCFKSFL